MGIIGYLIFSGLVLLILAPIIAGHFRNVRRDKSIINTLKGSGSAAGLTLSESDAWNGTYAIGIDTDQRRLVYLNRAGGAKEEVSADLSAARDCRVDITARTEKTPNGSMTVVEAISLVITFRDKGLREKRLDFYNNQIFPSPVRERTLAEKWQKIISTVIQLKSS